MIDRLIEIMFAGDGRCAFWREAAKLVSEVCIGSVAKYVAGQRRHDVLQGDYARRLIWKRKCGCAVVHYCMVRTLMQFWSYRIAVVLFVPLR